MKKEFYYKPDKFKEEWPGELSSFSWQDFLTAIPSPLLVVTTYKKMVRKMHVYNLVQLLLVIAVNLFVYLVLFQKVAIFIKVF